MTPTKPQNMQSTLTWGEGGFSPTSQLYDQHGEVNYVGTDTAVFKSF